MIQRACFVFFFSRDKPLEDAIFLSAPRWEVPKLYENDLTLSWPAEILRGLITR